MYEYLKKQLSEAVSLFRQHNTPDMLLGGISAAAPDRGAIVITPADLDYNTLSAADMCVVTADGVLTEGCGAPSPDYTTHLGLYLANKDIGALCHTYTTYANAYSQSGKGIKPYGALHAYETDASIPCTRKLTPAEIEEGLGTGFAAIIGELLASEPDGKLSSVLVYNNGAYSWADVPYKAARRAIKLEFIAESAFYTELMQKDASSSGIRMPEQLLRALHQRQSGEKS